MSIEQIAKLLADRNIKKVSISTGLSYRTVLSIARGSNTNPSYETLKKLEAYFNGAN